MERVEKLSVAEVAEVLSVPKGRVYEWTQRGHLPCLRLGGRTFVTVEALEAFVRAGGCPPRRRDTVAA
jgi:excisionase family DNA binding protein